MIFALCLASGYSTQDDARAGTTGLVQYRLRPQPPPGRRRRGRPSGRVGLPSRTFISTVFSASEQRQRHRVVGLLAGDDLAELLRVGEGGLVDLEDRLADLEFQAIGQRAGLRPIRSSRLRLPWRARPARRAAGPGAARRHRPAHRGQLGGKFDGLVGRE